jgi:hypothetical protein
MRALAWRPYRPGDAAGRDALPAPSRGGAAAALALQAAAGNRATSAALRAPDAPSPVATGARRLARLVEKEHKSLGDEGSGGAEYTRKGLTLTHGDLVMLSGDHFTEAEIFWLWDNPSPDPGKKTGTQDELICVLKQEVGGSDARFQPGGPFAGITFSEEVEAKVKERYYALANENTTHFADPGKAGFGVAGYPPGSAGATYHETHERAIIGAYRAGSKGDDPDRWLSLEATGEHFLTDAFSAGHLTTKRAAITDWWDRMYPNFGRQFVDKVSHDMAVKINDDATWLSGAITISMFEDNVRDQIMDKLKGKPLPTVATIVSLMTHAYDNEYGLWVTNDLGWRWYAFGDSKLDDPGSEGGEHSNREVAVTAVRLGTADVQTAYSMGRAGATAPLPDDQVLDQVRQRADAPATPGDRYAPEQLMPRVDPSEGQGEMQWKADSLEDLWTMRVRTAYATTFGEYIVKEMQADGHMGSELQDMHDGLDEEVDPFPWYAHILAPVMFGHGHVYPRAAFKAVVLDPVRDPSRCLPFLLAVVSS